MNNNILETKVLWSSDTPFKNQYSIVLEDSIDNYDEIIFYGSANRGGNDRVNVKTEFPVVSGCVNLGGPYTLNAWQSTNHYMLNNGTQVYLSGNSGFIDVSYYWGMQNGGTAFEANRYTTARNADVHPYKIVGVKNKLIDKIWETTGNTYETNITLTEPITHFNKLLIYSSGTENAAYGVHLAKNVYVVQPQTVNGCDAWGYSPWALNFKCNYILGCSLKLSGNSGHIGSAYYLGIGKDNATWAAGKWTGTEAPRMLQPYNIFGIDRKPTYNVRLLQTEGGTIDVTPNTGYEFDTSNLSYTANRGWDFTGYDATGAIVTNNILTFQNQNASVQAGFSAIPSYTITILPAEHGTVVASMPSGYRGETVSLTSTPDEGWYKNGYLTTGCRVVNDTFVISANAIIQGKYRDVEITILDFYPIGSYFTTKNADFDPNVEWGGEWELDTNGKVTRGGTSVGQTGGEITHATTTNELPGHTHTTTRFIERNDKGTNWGNDNITSVWDRRYGSSGITVYKGNRTTTSCSNTSNSHNNVQKSLICKRWHRVG